MQTLVIVYQGKNEFPSFTFRTFYGRGQKKKANDFINLMEKKRIKCEILN
jgi:hypothetical protein